MTERFRDRTALITGAGSGIGRALALRLADEGAAAVAVVDVRADRVDAVCAELEAKGAHALPLVVDLGDAEAARACVDDAADAFGSLDVAVSNAAITPNRPFLEETVENWNRIFAVNLTACFVIGQQSALRMIEFGRGGVILMTAAAVERGGATGAAAAYGASKTGVIQLVKGMAVALAPHKIRVNAVSPGATDTNIAIDAFGEEVGARAKAASAAGLAIGRIAEPDELAAAFAFLASDDASYVSGANLWVDGGWLGPGG